MRTAVMCGLLGLVLAGCGGAPSPEALHRRALVADLHSDTPLRMRDGFDIGAPHERGDGDMDLARLAEGGVDLQVFACWLPTELPTDSCVAAADLLIDSLLAQIARHRDRVGLCRTAAEAEEIIASGRLAALVSIENGVAIANDLANLGRFADRGVRCLALTHTASNAWCISSADTAPAFVGLTDFGREVVREMNRLGMIIDISHAHPEAVAEVLRISTDPVIASHSCVRALCDHDRNLTDDQIRAIAAAGGLIGVNFYNGYLSDEWNRVSDSLWRIYRPTLDSLAALSRAEGADSQADSLRRAERRRIYREVAARVDSLAPVDVAAVCDHIDYIVRLVGADYAGFGSDFDGVPSMPRGLEDCSGLPRITAELAARGYSESDIRKILGGNFLRVFRRVCDRSPAASG